MLEFHFAAAQAGSSAHNLTFRNQIRNQASLHLMLQSGIQHKQKSSTQMVPVQTSFFVCFCSLSTTRVRS